MKDVIIGEIFLIDGREYIIVLTEHTNGKIKWEQPTMVLLDKLIKNNQRKTKEGDYFRKFKCIKLSNVKKS